MSNSTSLLLRRQPRDRCQHVLELEVVHLHAVIEVQLNTLLSKGQQRVLLPGLAFLEHLGDFVGLLGAAVRSRAGRSSLS